ncbi:MULTISPECIES: hypothetical protein [unclassified Campylobacter]|uniref:hypothetical protein n=1 Tax=unclassified Campylobacter TaxID=2593542 RepID=UPI001DECD061|nr:hypothetical protein [Campylobacter sp. RM9331]MBZ8006299.1 hypothetical protein [Campylobacter sp. RM9332]
MNKSNSQLQQYITKLLVKICRDGSKIDSIINEKNIKKINDLANQQEKYSATELSSIIKHDSIGYDPKDKDNYMYILMLIIEFLNALIAHKQLNENSRIYMISFLFKTQMEIINETRGLNDSHTTNFMIDINSQIGNLDKKIKTLKAKQKNIAKDYIAILGIFAAIFMAFDSGLKIELEILSQVNDYAKGVLIIFIALFTYILLKSFYQFIINVYTDKVLEKTTNISLKQGILYFILVIVLAGIYCYLIYHIDEQYEQKIKPIVKEEMLKLQQKEEKERIIIHNNTSSTQNQENGLVQQQKTNNKQIKTNKNSDICKPIQK